MEEKPYIVSTVSINNEKRYVLFKITKSWCHTVLVASNVEELMIMIDLNGYDRNEIRFCDELKDYDLQTINCICKISIARIEYNG